MSAGPVYVMEVFVDGPFSLAWKPPRTVNCVLPHHGPQVKIDSSMEAEGTHSSLLALSPQMKNWTTLSFSLEDGRTKKISFDSFF